MSRLYPWERHRARKAPIWRLAICWWNQAFDIIMSSFYEFVLLKRFDVLECLSWRFFLVLLWVKQQKEDDLCSLLHIKYLQKLWDLQKMDGVYCSPNYCFQSIVILYRCRYVCRVFSTFSEFPATYSCASIPDYTYHGNILSHMKFCISNITFRASYIICRISFIKYDLS